MLAWVHRVPRNCVDLLFPGDVAMSKVKRSCHERLSRHHDSQRVRAIMTPRGCLKLACKAKGLAEIFEPRFSQFLLILGSKFGRRVVVVAQDNPIKPSLTTLFTFQYTETITPETISTKERVQSRKLVLAKRVLPSAISCENMTKIQIAKRRSSTEEAEEKESGTILTMAPCLSS